MGGAGAQHSPVGGSTAAPASVRSLSVARPRWTMNTWSRESTPTPMVEPRTQLFGSGLGQRGSTSKIGASTRAVEDASRAACPTPSATMPASRVPPRITLRRCFIWSLLIRNDPTEEGGVGPAPCGQSPEMRFYSTTAPRIRPAPCQPSLSQAPAVREMPWRNIRFRKALSAAALLLFAFGASSGVAIAHEIPPNVAVQAYLKPQGETLRVLIRVPLASMRDMDLPLRGPGYLAISQADQDLRDAAELWLAGYMSIYENDRLLADYRVAATH